MVLHNPNNWHWVNKDASTWAKSYFDEHLTKISAKDNEVSAKIDSVLDLDGDVDVSQRKGKVITLFDVKIRLEYSGKTADDKTVSGTITIPEVAHDTEEDEYVFEISAYSDSKEKEPVKDLVRQKILPQLRKALGKFAGDLIAEHGKDIQHGPDSGPTSTSVSPAPAKAVSPAPQKPGTPVISHPGQVVNTVTLSDTAEFQTTAEELYTTFVDPQRVAAFTRAVPQVFEPNVGGKFKLFGGNVEGEFSELEKPKKAVMKWRLGGWPAGHFSKLTLVFDQGYDTTVLRYTWEGVPVGQEDVAKKNFNEYYVKSIKITFGYVSHPSSILKLSMFVLLPAVVVLVAYYLYVGGFDGRHIKMVGDW
ncbi:activator of Hsp90 ATPase [Tirmania nivea]|nr:activator of Hsp90 ATPase [Tirmania nivea]